VKYLACACLAFLIVTYFLPRDSGNEAYAAHYFSNKTGVEEVIASKRMHDESDGWRGCLFAVVKFPEEFEVKLRSNGPTAVDLSKISLAGADRMLRWPSKEEWQITPHSPQSPHDEDAFLSCEDHLESTHANEINRLLSSPGSWTVRSWSRVAILSPDARLAAIFRYGD